MGLDITAYRKLERISGAQRNEDGEVILDDGQTLEWYPGYPYLTIHQNDELVGRERPLEIGGLYRSDESHGFCAGSYCWYSDWRNHLARIVGWPKHSRASHGSHLSSRHDYARSAWNATEGKLWEWISFSDCEGIIGSIAAKKIYAEMLEIKITLDDFDDKCQYSNFMDKWDDWLKAFEMAADGGAVEFH